MFDIAFSEMVVVAIIALIIIGPKELPRVLRTVGQWVRKARRLAAEFNSSIDDLAREADLEDARKALKDARNLDLEAMIEKEVDPTGSVREEMSRDKFEGAEDKPALSARKWDDPDRAGSAQDIWTQAEDDMIAASDPMAPSSAAPSSAAPSLDKPAVVPPKTEEARPPVTPQRQYGGGAAPVLPQQAAAGDTKE